MTRQRLSFLFNRYIDQTISETEKSEFFKAIAQADHDPELKELIDELWTSIPNDPLSEVPEYIFQKITQGSPVEKINSTRSRWLKIAASISVLTIVGSVIYFTMNPNGDTKITSEQSTIPKLHDSFIRLPDGSTVVLNEGSFLHYPKSFEGEPNRIVKLEGEGYFDIQHDPAHPFIVISGNVVTTVLGTAFNIKAFPNDNEVTVTVSRGKVKVSSDKKLVGVLTQDQQVIIKNGVANRDTKVDAREATAWMEADIVFNDVTLKEALEELEERFDTKIVLDDKRAYDCRFTGSFVHGENIEQILLVVCEFNNVTMHHNTETEAYEITGAGCN